MAKHTHGSMNIETQEKTFNGFVATVVRSVVFILVALVFLAIVNG